MGEDMLKVFNIYFSNKNNLYKQFLKFLTVSGVGFLIDFIVYYFLITLVEFPVAGANIVSSIPAITYVFFLSIRKVFVGEKNNIKLRYKYFIYIIYQMLLVYLVSMLAQKLYYYFIVFFTSNNILIRNIKIIVKCLITPITMSCNFIFLKILSEKI